jgi:beta-glucosidase
MIKILLCCCWAIQFLPAQTENDIPTMVDKLLQKMTIEEKVGQMTQITLEVVAKQKGWTDLDFEVDKDMLRHAILEKHIGSILNVYEKAHTVEQWQALLTLVQNIATKESRLKIPVIYGIDAIHGSNYINEATLFPQSIAMAAARNPELVKKSAEITAYETRIVGIPWNFNPVLGLGRNPLWPRMWETFGEDPYLASVMAVAYVDGIEGEINLTDDQHHIAACAKHYIGYSVPLSGKDRTPAWIPDRILRDLFLKPFKAAIEAGVHTVMVNSGEVNGIPTHSDHYLLTTVLKEELGFKGFVVSDWADVIRLYDRDKVAESPKDAVRMAVMAGIDMSMVPFNFSFYDLLLELVKAGEVPESRIDDAVRRILTVKFKTGLFDNPYPFYEKKDDIGTDVSAQVSLEAAHEALTLLKNDGILPLSKSLKVLVTGPNANLLKVLNGGWSYSWQGDQESFYPQEKMTVLEAVQNLIGADNVSFVPGSEYDKIIDVQAAVNAAKKADVTIVCIGEMPYCETPGNINDLSLPAAQIELVKAIQNTGTPTVLVLIEGRPRVITPVVDKANAILLAYLPGNEGGIAIADVLFGEVNPSGKLPYTYPRFVNDLTNYDYKPLEIHDNINKRNPLYEFGHGLSYTTFNYSKITLHKTTIKKGETVTARVTVTNTGKVAGKETVELYLSDLVRSVSPPNRQLKRFQKINLQPGESKTVEFQLTEADLEFYDRNNQIKVEPGKFKITIGNKVAFFELVSISE